MTVYAWPAIFSGPNVRALLAGRKTMTRRLPTSMWANVAMHHEAGDECWLWVRETWGAVWPDENWRPLRECTIEFKADLPPGCNHQPGEWPADDAREAGFDAPKWRPSIHMPRWASRLSLKVEAIGLERLQDISEADAVAEGSQTPIGELPPSARKAAWSERQAFSRIWNSLHTKPGTTWADNPTVYAVCFGVTQANIDSLLKEAA